MKKKIVKFPSIFGYSTTSAKKGDRIPVAFRINCNDGYPSDSKLTMANDALDNIIYPQIIRLVKDGSLPENFILSRAHMLMYANEYRNEILLNESVRFLGNVLFEDNKTFQKGDPVNFSDVKEVLGLYPSEKNDPNAAHIMLVKLNGKWHYAADLVYNRDKVRKRFETSKMFLNVSIYCSENKLWGPFADNIFSATELSIQCILLLLHYGKYSVKQTHDETMILFAEFTRNGNVDVKFSQLYQNLTDLRKKGRYLECLHGHAFTITQDNSQEFLDIAKDLIEIVEKLLASINLAKKPPAGDYIAFGNEV